MTESSYYSEENFNLSYEERQKELRRMIISMRCNRHLSVAELAEKAEFPFLSLMKWNLVTAKYPC